MPARVLIVGFVGRTYHLAAMPGTRRRARLVLDWTLAMLFKRDSADLGAEGTSNV
jgi:NADH dehydrogenase